MWLQLLYIDFNLTTAYNVTPFFLGGFVIFEN